MQNRGMPGCIELLQSNPKNLVEYLDGIFSTIVYKDIMIRNNINDKSILESVLKFIYDL